jgi:hypothetical protein
MGLATSRIMTSPKLAIYGAIAANVAIAVTKLLVAGITGSSAMLVPRRQPASAA